MVRKRKENKKRKFKWILFSIFILVLLLVILILFQFNFFKIFDSKEITFSRIVDLCGPNPLGGGLLHSIKDEDFCKISCNNECTLKKMDFSSFEFELKNDSCNLCICYCK